MALRRAHADEYAVRVNRAVALLRDRSPADSVRALQAEHGLSERQARRYVNAALERPDAERGDHGGGAVVSRSGPRATRWQGALRSSSCPTGSPARGWRRRTRS